MTARRQRASAILALVLLVGAGCAKTERAPYAPLGHVSDDGGAGQATPDGSLTGGLQTTSSTASPQEQADMLAGWGAGIMDPDKICAGSDHSCAIDRQGGVHCWGAYPDTPGGLPPMAQIACGNAHTCALATDGTLWCWGAGSDQSLVDMALAHPEDTSLLVHQGQAIPPAGHFKRIAAGGVHSCAIDMNDQVVCWGGGTGDKDNERQPNYGQSIAPSGKFISIACGQAHSCAVDDKGGVVCWGAGGTSDNCFPPRAYDCGQSNSPPGAFLEVSAGDEHSCGLREDGTIRCWGAGQHDDQCAPLAGTNALECGQSMPPTPAMDAPFVRLRSGWEFTCGVTQDFKLQCWGWDDYRMATPKSGKYTQVAVGDTHACGIQLSGRIVCWGADDSGKASVPPGVP